MIHGLVLAAGASRRAGFPKGLAKIGRRTLLSIAIGTLRKGGCARITVVVGGPHRTAMARLARSNRAEVVVNEAPERGMFSSLQLGLREEATVVSLVDHPHARPEVVRALISLVKSGSAAAIPTFKGTPGHPYAVSRAMARTLKRSSPQTNAHRVLSRARRVTKVPVDDRSVLEDLDTPGRLRASGVTAPRR